jgi:aminoglycoside 6'-N-acetyltransferase I
MDGAEQVERGPVWLRAATEDDLPALLDLTVAFYDDDGFTAARADLRDRLASFLREPAACLTVAATSEGVVGFALTTIRLVLESGPVAELQDLYVVPAHRRAGVGSALVADAARWARAGSAAILDVVIAPNGRDVDHLQHYYSARGFADRGRRLVHLDLSSHP